jgi:uncharacterized protein with von Willebrand factor type A (vWA) domain
VIFVGDAAMAPYEITQPAAASSTGTKSRVCVDAALHGEVQEAHLDQPVPKQAWDYTASTHLVRDLIEDKMYPLTLQGLEEGMRSVQVGI